jgi:hypothetical protein
VERNPSRSTRLEQPSTRLLGDIEARLRQLIEALAREPAARKGPGAPLVLPAMLLWSSVIVGVLRGFRSQAELWRLVSVYGLWSYPRVSVSEEAVRRRLMGATEQMRLLFEQITGLLAARLAPYTEASLAGFAAMVVALDAMTLDPVVRQLPMLQNGKRVPGSRLPGKLATRFDLRLQQWQRVEYVADAHENDKVRGQSLVEDLPRGSLILADLGYFAFAWFDWLTEKGHFWISRIREKTTYEVIHVFYAEGETRDELVWLGQYRADRAAHAVRLVQFRVDGHVARYLTNVLDPAVLPVGEIARLYARRWDVELAFKLVKRELGLHLLWSSNLEIILSQVWAVLLISQILQGIRKEVAGRAEVDVFEVSMPLLVEAVVRFAERGLDPIEAVVERGRFARIIRPSRRIRIRAPEIPPEQIAPLPAGIVLRRRARYAHRKCGPRKPKSGVQK